MEIEAKFRVSDPATFDALRHMDQAGPLRLVSEPQIEHQHNTYFDTADRRLRIQHYGLRTRDLGTRRIATLKGEARIADGIHERDEWEVEIGNEARPEHWPASELRDRLLALTGGAALHTILTIETQRQHIYALRDGARVAEISLDAGIIHAGGLQEAFRELEVELLADGTRADFDMLVAELRQRFALPPEPRSKLARGLALLARAEEGVAG